MLNNKSFSKSKQETCVYCNSNCTHLFFVHPKVIIAFYIFIKQGSACSTSGVEVYPNTGGVCGLEVFFTYGLFG